MWQFATMGRTTRATIPRLYSARGLERPLHWSVDMQTNSTTTDPGLELHGQGVRAAIEQRRAALEEAFALLQNSEQQGSPAAEAIEIALSTLAALMPEDLQHISPVVASSLTHWLEANKHLGMQPPKKRRAR